MTSWSYVNETVDLLAQRFIELRNALRGRNDRHVIIPCIGRDKPESQSTAIALMPACAPRRTRQRSAQDLAHPAQAPASASSACSRQPMFLTDYGIKAKLKIPSMAEKLPTPYCHDSDEAATVELRNMGGNDTWPRIDALFRSFLIGARVRLARRRRFESAKHV